jgi:2-dehydro-3-deoxygluconokinase
VSGGEFNVAANLADAFRLRSAIVTAMTNYPIGELVAERVRAMGVRAFYKHFEHNGVSGPNIATVYSDRGYGVRPPVVFYNRANEAAALLEPGDVDWDAIFSAGVRWFHSGGIFASLSQTTGELIIEGMRAARKAGAVTSFDLNFREKLWRVWGGHERATRIIDRIVENTDVLFGVDIPGARDDAPLDASAFAAAAEQVLRQHPHLQCLATTLRRVHSAGRHSWSAVAWIDGSTYQAPVCELDVYDRVGSGDGFVAGLIYGLLAGENPETALRLGWAHGALLTTYPGDTTMATLEQVRAFAEGGSARIQR